MISSAQPGRKIASNLLFTGRELLADPLVTVGGGGEILAVETCASPDRCAGVEFYAGILVPALVDACCDTLTPGALLRHRNSGTAAGCIGAAKPVEDSFFRAVGAEFVFLSETVSSENKVILIDRALTPEDMDVSAGRASGWCLCPAAVGVDALPETLALLRRFGIAPALGSLGAPSGTPLAGILPLLAGEPVAEVLAWATIRGAQILGFADEVGEIAPGRRCGLNVLSGLDYSTLRLTAQTRLSRIL